MTDIDQLDYASWKHHPVSETFRQYLADFRDMLIKETVAQWRSGKIQLSTEQQLLGRIQVIDEILDLEFSHIEEFYKDAAKTTPTGQNT